VWKKDYEVEAKKMGEFPLVQHVLLQLQDRFPVKADALRPEISPTSSHVELEFLPQMRHILSGSTHAVTICSIPSAALAKHRSTPEVG
jgi:hypothetical protein